jgi:hypothetical protein
MARRLNDEIEARAAVRYLAARFSGFDVFDKLGGETFDICVTPCLWGNKNGLLFVTPVYTGLPQMRGNARKMGTSSTLIYPH